MNSKLALLILASAAGLCAQFGPPGPPAPAPGKAGAPVDLTGYWVAYVTEDWRWRMVTPLKGDAASIPTNAEARKVTDAWDPAKDEAAGLQCKAYGAPAIMRVPGRLHITWQDDKTIEDRDRCRAADSLASFFSRSSAHSRCIVARIFSGEMGRPCAHLQSSGVVRSGPVAAAWFAIAIAGSDHNATARRLLAQERRSLQR